MRRFWLRGSEGRAYAVSVKKDRRRPPEDLPAPIAGSSGVRGWPELPWVWILPIAVVIAYLPVWQAGFIWDDDAYVTNNQTLRSFAGLLRIWGEPGSVPQYYPLVFTTFWIEHHLWGDAPLGYHLTNVALHAGSAVLVGRLLAHLGVRAAWLAALVFALHPVHVESVAWVTERKNVLSGFFYLASLSAFFAARGVADRSVESGNSRHDLLAMLFFVAALLSKTVTCSLPLAVLIVTYWKNGTIGRRDLLRTVPFFVVGLVLAGVTVWMERAHVGAQGADWDLSFLQRCTIAGRAVWFSFAKLIAPFGLTFVYPRWTTSVEVLGVAAFLSLPVLLVSLVAMVPRWGRGPFAGALYYGATLFPALGFVNVFPMRYTFTADHYQYLASLGPIVVLCAAASVAVERLRISPGAAIGGGSAVVVLLGVLTMAQARIYRDAETLWEDTLSKDPQSGIAHNNLGLLLAERGRLDEAARHYEAVLQVKPNDSFAANNLGNVANRRGDARRAEEYFALAVRSDPGSAEARSNLGNMLAARGDLVGAEEHYRAAIAMRPGWADVHGNLGNVLAMRGDREAALLEFDLAVRADPQFADAHFNRALLLAGLGRIPEAIDGLRVALQLRPNWTAARDALADFQGRVGRSNGANVNP